MSNFCHPENPGSSHWLGCACSESAWAEKLAAAQAELAIARAVARPLFSRRMLEEKLVAAEERARRLDEAIKDEIGWLSGMGERTRHLVTPASCRERAWKLTAALAPPPEAAKRGEG